ncbi:hypothetical protein, partial [Rhizobium leguminosarum]|uniref:hypothetical protein n=1 Tax=Rhizobium leguminosarum TaxID=384 RepID=UPI003F9665A0
QGVTPFDGRLWEELAQEGGQAVRGKKLYVVHCPEMTVHEFFCDELLVLGAVWDGQKDVVPGDPADLPQECRNRFVRNV